jgi:ABC-type Fe3+/spermidine/putrescine transport system ATPase subunit
MRGFGPRIGVDGVWLDAKRGQVFCLQGSWGCGKSTTLRITAELERADSVALARMLAPEPDVALMAEPLSGLDTRLRARRNPQTSEGSRNRRGDGRP